MLQSKNITIQIWNDQYFCRVIGIWYPVGLKDNDAPFCIVLSSMFNPRVEVMGTNPVAPDQHPMPKEFLEAQTRHMAYLFANEFGIFQAPSKPLFKAFIAKQTIGYSMIKEFKMDVSPASGSITLAELRNSIDQYTEEEQKKINVLTVGEHPKDADAKQIDSFIHTDKFDAMRQYISITKLTPVYEVKDPYIVNTSVPLDPATLSFSPGTEEHPLVKAELEKVATIIEADNINRSILGVIDNTDETLSRCEALQTALMDKNKQLIDNGIIPPTLPEKEVVPQPTKESEIYNIPGVIMPKNP